MYGSPRESQGESPRISIRRISRCTAGHSITSAYEYFSVTGIVLVVGVFLLISYGSVFVWSLQFVWCLTP